jgi:hypothetical protein
VTTVVVAGLGETGIRTARQLLDTPSVDRVVVASHRESHAREVAQALHDGAEPWVLSADGDLPSEADAIACALPAGTELALARAAVERSIPFASTTDQADALSALHALDPSARLHATTVLPGCGLAPGLADVLVRHAAGVLDAVDEVHVARFGVAGDACADVARRVRHEPSVEWRGRIVVNDRRRGAELVWFPDPVGARECTLVATGVEQLASATPGVDRVTVRLGEPVSRRFTPPSRRDPAAGFGAVRVEVWGWQGAERATVVYGVIERTAVAAGTVLGVAAAWLAGALPEVGEREPGALGLGTAVKPVPFLAELARRGVKAAVFEGVPVA